MTHLPIRYAVWKYDIILRINSLLTTGTSYTYILGHWLSTLWYKIFSLCAASCSEIIGHYVLRFWGIHSHILRHHMPTFWPRAHLARKHMLTIWDIVCLYCDIICSHYQTLLHYETSYAHIMKHHTLLFCLTNTFDKKLVKT